MAKLVPPKAPPFPRVPKIHLTGRLVQAWRDKL